MKNEFKVYKRKWEKRKKSQIRSLEIALATLFLIVVIITAWVIKNREITFITIFLDNFLLILIIIMLGLIKWQRSKLSTGAFRDRIICDDMLNTFNNKIWFNIKCYGLIRVGFSTQITIRDKFGNEQNFDMYLYRISEKQILDQTARFLSEVKGDVKIIHTVTSNRVNEARCME